MLRFDLERIQRIFLSKRCRGSYDHAARDRRRQLPTRTAESPPFGKTGAEFPRFLMEDLMSIWTCVLGWFRFTVPDSTADEVMSQIGGE
jgi:hypothetical protein